MSAKLSVEIDDTGKANVSGFGDMAQAARAIIRFARTNEEFLLTLNVGMILLNDDIRAAEVRDEMIGMIQNTEQ